MLSVELFGSSSAHRDEVADVAIVAVGGRRISVFLISARARVGVVNARFGVARSAGEGNHSANSTAGINSRECIGQYARPYPAIVVKGGGVRTTKGVYLGGYKYCELHLIYLNPILA